MTKIEEIKKKYEHPAYEIMNSNDCAKMYPTIYDVCYCLFYRGEVPQTLIRDLSRLQSHDARFYNYVPTDLLNKTKSLLQ